ncbi:hypothetical protein [Nonomuraea sp. NPDC050310]|uniref:hypothetical protein n=1 Tax=Nonomuraea sp. NPDC050310 TaxID=3154935 RepID=UPI0033C26043
MLVKVAATSFSPSEIGLRRGLLHDVLGLTLPHPLGWDVAGNRAHRLGRSGPRWPGWPRGGRCSSTPASAPATGC